MPLRTPQTTRSLWVHGWRMDPSGGPLALTPLGMPVFAQLTRKAWISEGTRCPVLR
jgi:hypothetical protein